MHWAYIILLSFIVIVLTSHVMLLHSKVSTLERQIKLALEHDETLQQYLDELEMDLFREGHLPDAK